MKGESAISIFRKLPENKQQVKHYAKLIRESVLGGEVDPLLFAAQVKALEELVKELRSDILVNDCILDEASKHNQKTFNAYNAKFTITEAGTKYDYSDCGDTKHQQLLDLAARSAAELKAREDWLKSIPVGAEIYNEDGVRVCRPLKTSKTIVSITLNS